MLALVLNLQPQHSRINTLERRLFSAPYEAKDCDAKMAWFLARFGRVLKDPESAWGDWQHEYTRVRAAPAAGTGLALDPRPQAVLGTASGQGSP
jgi:hypothetical protein